MMTTTGAAGSSVLVKDPFRYPWGPGATISSDGKAAAASAIIDTNMSINPTSGGESLKHGIFEQCPLFGKP
jgi:hypothetical protein